MARPSRKAIVRALLGRQGQTFAEELGIKVERNTPSPLFELMVASLLLSARIDHRVAADAARSMRKEGWRTAEKMAASSWEKRVEALNWASYTRYQERTSTMLGDASERLLEHYGGDLRKLRDEADRDPKQERKLLKKIKGVGDVGVDIYFREAQVAWDQLAPHVDRRAKDAAQRLDLPADGAKLAKLANGQDARLVAALVRCELEDDYDAVRKAAR